MGGINLESKKKATLKKKIEGIVYDLIIRTSSEMVYVDDTTTLDVKLEKMLSDISDSKNKLAILIGNDAVESISSQIDEAINDAITTLNNNLTNESLSTSLAAKIKQNTTAISSINNTSTGILANAKNYTDNAKNSLRTELTNKFGSAFQFKGTVNYVDQLPTTGVSSGDIYQVKYRGNASAAGTKRLDAEYVYNGTEYVELGSIVDLSAYSTTSQMNTAINDVKSTLTTEINKKATKTELTNLTNKVNTKARFIVSSSQPADLTEVDVWCKIL